MGIEWQGTLTKWGWSGSSQDVIDSAKIEHICKVMEEFASESGSVNPMNPKRTVPALDADSLDSFSAIEWAALHLREHKKVRSVVQDLYPDFPTFEWAVAPNAVSLCRYFKVQFKPKQHAKGKDFFKLSYKDFLSVFIDYHPTDYIPPCLVVRL